MDEPPSLELVDVSVDRRDRKILSDLSFGLSRGMTALLGRNGAGKTTLMRVLAGVQPPRAGVVSVDGLDLYRSPNGMARHLRTLGWVPQAPGYPGGMRVEHFVQYAAWLKRMGARERRSAAASALAACNVDRLAGRRMKSLSGGERQRVVLASAIVSDPRVILLDEPTAGLDPAQRESYLDLLRRLSRDAIVLYSTHLVDDVVRTATRVVVLDRGRLSHDLSGPELTHDPAELGDTLRRAVISSGDRNA